MRRSPIRCSCPVRHTWKAATRLADETLPSATPDGIRPVGDHETRNEVWQLHALYQQTRCPAVLAELCEEYRGYTLSIARRWHRDGEPLEDLNQVALEALVLALQRFDCTYRLPFIGYAKPTIIGSLKRHFRDHGWALRVPRTVHEQAGKIQQATADLTVEQGRRPSTDELAARLDLRTDEVRSITQAVDARTPVSLDAMALPDGGGAPTEVAVLDGGFERADGRLAVAEAMAGLDRRSQEVLARYFFGEQTQAQIAAHYGVSQMQVSRWINGSLRRLRTWVGAPERPAH